MFPDSSSPAHSRHRTLHFNVIIIMWLIFFPLVDVTNSRRSFSDATDFFIAYMSDAVPLLIFQPFDALSWKLAKPEGSSYPEDKALCNLSRHLALLSQPVRLDKEGVYIVKREISYCKSIKDKKGLRPLCLTRVIVKAYMYTHKRLRLFISYNTLFNVWLHDFQFIKSPHLQYSYKGSICLLLLF